MKPISSDAPPPRAWGEVIGTAVIRRQPEDFFVEEQLGFEPTGEGEHVFLQIEKRNLNTAELGQSIARLAGVSSRDVGYAGLKDRNAVTRQWFSVGLAGKPEPDWAQIESGGSVSVLKVTRNAKKLATDARRRHMHVERQSQFLYLR